jgi:hypothetical protein
MRLPIVLTLIVLAAGCGRREKPSPFDARRPAMVDEAVGKPVPPSGARVRWGTLTFPETVETDRVVRGSVQFTNAGNALWLDRLSANPKRDGSYAVRLAHAWVRADDMQHGRATSGRTDLLRPVLPGESIDLRVDFRTPAKPGQYRLQIEFMQEGVQWFADHGADRLTQPVHVVLAPEAVGTTTTSPADPPPTAPIPR